MTYVSSMKRPSFLLLSNQLRKQILATNVGFKVGVLVGTMLGFDVGCVGSAVGFNVG